MRLLSKAVQCAARQREWSRRHFWGWLNAVFNKVDYERIKAVGPDRAAAEWLLRCGAKVRFQGFDRWHQDYNAMPTGPLGRYKIQAIDATESCIMYRGFDHLAMELKAIPLCVNKKGKVRVKVHLSKSDAPKVTQVTRMFYTGRPYYDLVGVSTPNNGLKHLEEIKFNKCMYIEDTCLERLSSIENLQESLYIMEVVSCGNVTDKGIIALHKLRNLEYLFLSDLPGIKDKQTTADRLQTALPRLDLALDLD